MSETRTPIEARVAKLERFNRVLLAGLAGSAMLLAVSGAGGSNDPIRAPAFQLVDDTSFVRAEIAFKDDNPGLFIKDETGVDRLLAVHDAEGTGLYITDTTGTTRIGVARFADEGGGVALHGPGSKGAAVLHFKGEGSLRFFDTAGMVTRQITASSPENE